MESEQEGVNDYGILRAWGNNPFWNFQRSRARVGGGGVVKIRKLSVVWYGYFLESAILTQAWGENIRRGTLGGTQYYNTVRKIGKYWNTMSKIDEIPNDTAFMIGHAYLKLYPSRMFIYLKHVCTRNQPQL